LLFTVVQCNAENKPLIRIVTDEATGQKQAYIIYEHRDYASQAVDVFNGEYSVYDGEIYKSLYLHHFL